MLVIGIDPGTATTGYGLVRENADGSLAVVDYGVILTPPELPMPERLLELYRQLRDICFSIARKAGRWRSCFFSAMSPRPSAWGRGAGWFCWLWRKPGCRWQNTPRWKLSRRWRVMAGRIKHQVQQMVRALLGLDLIPKPDDAADALAIAICHLQYSRWLLHDLIR